jgi:proline iminopeptidase
MSNAPAFPAPHATGRIDVGDGNLVAWTASGDPSGVPALIVHGGPGSGCPPSLRRYFDPAHHRVVTFDQRGCGDSLPHASDPATDLACNTTAHLLADMERLREQLAIDRWLLFGGSWGATLSLAYAQRHPERVSGIVLTAVTLGRHSEIDWLYGGVSRFLPEEWEAFRAAVPVADRDGDLPTAYARMLDDPALRDRAVTAWITWEDAIIARETRGRPGAYSEGSRAELTAFVRIAAHYFSHRAWLEDGVLLRDAHRLTGIPGVLVHGRLDLGSPLENAWLLARAWPDAELVVVDDAGHTGSDTAEAQLRDAVMRLTPS